MLRTDWNTLKARVRDVETALSNSNLSALVVFGNGSALGHGSRTHGYLRYLCNWDGHNTPSILILIPGRTPTLLTPNIFLKFLSKDLLWFDNVHFVKPPGFAAAVRQALEEFGRDNGRVGYIGRDETPVTVWEGLEKELPSVDWVDFTSELDNRRVTKDQLQLSFHRRAAEICDSLFETVAREVRTGKKAYQIQAEMEKTARYAGAEYILTWLTVMPCADYSHFYNEECMRVPQRGDQVLAGIYLIYDGHWGHAIRTGTFGRPTEAHQRIFDIVLEIEEAGLSALRMKKNLFDVNRAFEAVINSHYPQEEDQGIFRFRAAHGLGYSYEDPVVTAAFPQPYDKNAAQPSPDAFIEIQPGMLFEFHPNLFVSNVAGAAIGDMVAATDGEPEILNNFPRELIKW